MANRLEVAKVKAILGLHEQGWSQRRIALTLGVDRKTVAEHLRIEASKRAKAPSGKAPPGDDSKRAKAPPGSGAAEQAAATPENECAGRGRSDCEAYRERILEQLELGLSAKRIHQDLVAEHGFEGSYYSVRRFTQRLRTSRPLPFRRMESEPGEEAQVDFGTGAPIVARDGRRRKSHVFRNTTAESPRTTPRFRVVAASPNINLESRPAHADAKRPLQQNSWGIQRQKLTKGAFLVGRIRTIIS